MQLPGWKGEEECRALPRLRLYPDPAAIALDDALANSQADAGAGILMPVQALEYAENLPGVAGLDSDSVVLHRELPVPVLGSGIDQNLRRLAGSVLQGVAHQILKQLHQTNLMGVNHGQLANRDFGLRLF